MRWTYALGLLGLMWCAAGPVWSEELPVAAPTAGTQLRLVLVEIDHWKIPFFGLPSEVPMLLPINAESKASIRQYDFTEGMQAMDVFLNLRPKDPKAPVYTRFLHKWPLYQEFFRAIENEGYEQAEGLLQKIYALDPAEPAVYFYRASLRSQQGKYALAESDYRQCIKRFSAYIPAYINLARLVRRRGDMKEAELVLRQALAAVARPDQTDARQVAEKMLASLQEK